MTELVNEAKKITESPENVAPGRTEFANKASQEAYSKEAVNIAADPGRACVKDEKGFIVCGPIVGYERPSGEEEKAGKVLNGSAAQKELFSNSPGPSIENDKQIKEKLAPAPDKADQSIVNEEKKKK